MEKYYYYAFRCKGRFGSGIRCENNGCFSLAEIHKLLLKNYKERCIVCLLYTSDAADEL